MDAVERLYRSASYEEALAALETFEHADGNDTLESAEYRILCLLGLGYLDRAEIAIEKLVQSHPDYRPNPARFSPSRQEQFNAIRRRVLARIFRDTAVGAKVSFDDKDYDSAVLRLGALLELLKAAAADNDPQFADVRIFASEFFERAKVAAVVASASRPVGMSGAATNSEDGENLAASTTGRATVYDVSSTDVVPPVALKPILPPMSPEASIVTPNPGLFEILIDESGQVQSAFVRRSVNAQYDALVLRESRKWQFKPATRNGHAVPFLKLVEIYAVPLASLRQ